MNEPTVTFTFDAIERDVLLTDLGDDVAVTTLREESGGADFAACDISNILVLADQERFMLIDLLASLPACKVTVAENTFNDVFSAVLSLPAASANMVLFRNWKVAALEAAALLCPDALEAPCGLIAQTMRGRGVKGVRQADLVAQARKIMAGLNAGPAAESSPPQTVRDVLPDAPVADGAVVPAGWALSDGSTVRLTDSDAGLPAAVVITERGFDTQRTTETVTVAWKRGGEWRSRTVSRREVADARAIVALAEYGLPVTNNTARDLVQYLDDFEAVNFAVLPQGRVSGRMGWQGTDGAEGFLWGRALITAESVFSDAGPEADGAPRPISFREADAGDGQLADAFRAAGSYEGWLAAVALVEHHPRALAAFYAAFVPPMLRVLNETNFVVDLAGETSGGKTTVQRLVASVWGDPVEGREASVVHSWNGTRTWTERVPAVCGDLPFVMDDTKNAGSPEEVAKTLYSVVLGQGKGRGTPLGIARYASFSTVLFSSGEQPAVSFTPDAGTRPRVLSFWGSPFGEKNLETGNMVRRLNAHLRDHHGHAGPRFVQFLLQHRDEWERWRAECQDCAGAFAEEAGDDAVAGRLAAPFAVIYITAHYVHEALGLPWPWRDPIKDVRSELIRGTSGADAAADALRAAHGWAVAHRRNFFHAQQTERDQPADGWAGRWDHDLDVRPGSETDPWPWLGFMPDVLRKVLEAGQFSYDATLKTWRDRQWLETDNDSRNTKKVKMLRDATRLVAIRRGAIEADDGE